MANADATDAVVGGTAVEVPDENVQTMAGGVQDDEVATAAAAVAGLRAENRLLCSNFDELQEMYLRLQERAEDTKKQLVRERDVKETAFQEHMREKRELQEKLRQREEEVLRIRADGLQKSDFQRLQLQIREELEAPYEESIKVLKATAEEARLERERLARENVQEKAILEATASELRQSLSALQGEKDTETDLLNEQLRNLRDERDAMSREHGALQKKVGQMEVLEMSNRQLTSEIDRLRSEYEHASSRLDDAELTTEKRVARVKAEFAASAQEHEVVHRRCKFLETELRTACEANGNLQRDLAAAEARIVSLEARAAESSRSIDSMHTSDMHRYSEAEKAWEAERQSLFRDLEEQRQALATATSTYRDDLERASLESSTRLRELEDVHHQTVLSLEKRCAEFKARILSLETASGDASKDFVVRLHEATNSVAAARSDAARAESEAAILRQEVLRTKEMCAMAEGRVAVARDEAAKSLDALHAERRAWIDERLRAEGLVGQLRSEVARERELRSTATKGLDDCREQLGAVKAQRAKDRKEYKAELLRQRRQRRQLKETTRAALNELVSAVDVQQITVAEERKREKLFAEIENIRNRQAHYLS